MTNSLAKREPKLMGLRAFMKINFLFWLCLGSLIYYADWSKSSAQTTQGGIIPPGLGTFFDKNGKPLSGGSVYFYTGATGSTVPKTTYSDINLTVPNTNPVILNAAGQAALWGTGNYRQQVYDKNNNLIWDVLTSAAGSGSSGGGTIATGDGDLVGTIKPWAGPVAPNQYMFAYGEQLNRTTYSALFTAITSNQAVFCSSGSPILSGLGDTTNFWIGMTVEVSCVSAGVTTVIAKTSSTVTLAANANATINTNATFFMWGNGDGITTFTLPDFRGIVPMGNNIMGGVASSHMSDFYFGSQSANSAGALGGATDIILGLTNIPSGIPSTGSNSISVAPSNGSLVGFPVTATKTNINGGTTGTSGGGVAPFSTSASWGGDDHMTGTNTINVSSTNAGGVAVSATISAAGSGYTNGIQTVTLTGGTCTTQPQFNITVSGGVLNGTPTLLTPGLCSVTTSNPASTLGGGGTGGTLNVTYSIQPIPTIQPSRTVNYIIKVTPDANSATASGVTSLGGMTGSISCGTGLICTGNNIAVNAGATTIIVNTTPISGGTNGSLLYDNAGAVGVLATLPAANFGALTGDVTNTAGSYATTISSNAVSNSKLATAGAATFKGNPTNATANVTDFTIQGLTARGAPDASNDKIPLYDNAAGTIKYVTPGQVASSATAGVSSLNGNTGAIIGVDTSTINAQTSSYSVLSSDCGKIIYATGGQNTITLPSTSGFPTACIVTVKNGETYTGTTGRAKILSGFPADLFVKLWPLQTVVVRIEASSWVTTHNPGRWIVPTGVTLHVDKTSGSNANDCLAATTSACADAQTAWAIEQYQFDNQGQSPIIAMACSETHTVALNMGGTPLGTNLVQISPDGNCGFTWQTTGPTVDVADLSEVNLDINYYGSSGSMTCNSNTSNTASTGCVYLHNTVVMDMQGLFNWTPGGTNDNAVFCDGPCEFTIANGIIQLGAGGGNYVINMSEGGKGTQSGTINATASGGLGGGVYNVFGGALLIIGTATGTGWSSIGASKVNGHGTVVTNGITPDGGYSTGASGALCTTLTSSC